MESASQNNLVKVMATGVFDLLHPGHLYFLEQSRAHGTELVVLVTNDEVVRQSKGEPLFDQESRRHLVAGLSCVDQAIIPTETDPAAYYKTVLSIAPDIITLGHDQHFDEATLAADLAVYGWHGKIVRIDKYPDGDISSSQLKAKLRVL